MAIPASQPRSLDPTPFDTWIITQVHVWNGGCAPFGMPKPLAARFQATLIKSRTRADGIAELSPHPADTVQVDIQDVLAYASQHGDAATALAALITAIANYAAGNGLL